MDVALLLSRSDPARRVAFSEDVVVDVLAGSHAALQRRLSQRVAEVAARPDLWATLREFYRADLDRGRTARRLGIHRSTLDYRLNRIEQLTDASPSSVHGILLFTAALATAHLPAQLLPAEGAMAGTLA
jgi:sugar diacid utilization regulator